MGDQEYAAAVGALGFYGSLMQEIVKEYGWDKALDMSSKVGRQFGLSSGEELKRSAAGKKPDIVAVEAFNSSMMGARSGVHGEEDGGLRKLRDHEVPALRCPEGERTRT